MAIAAPLASDRSAGHAGAAHPRRHRRRHRLCRPGAGALLARHPAVTLTTAMSSGATSAPRPLPALARIWDGAVVPLDVDRLVARRRRRVPGAARGGVRGAGAGAARARRPRHRPVRRVPHPRRRRPAALVSGDRRAARRHGLRADRAASATRSATARLVSNPGCYPTAALLALEPLAAAGLLDGRGRRRREVGHLGRRQGADASARTSRRTTAASPPTASSRTGTRRRSSRSSDAPVTFVPHLVPLDRGILETIYASLTPGTTEPQVADALQRAYADAPFVRLTGGALPEIKHVAHTNFCDIGWKVDAERRPHRARGGDRQPGQGRGGLRRSRTSTSCSGSTSGRACCEAASGRACVAEARRRAARAAAGRRARRARRSRALAAAIVAGRRARRRQGDRRGAGAAGIPKQQVDGLRVTDAPTLDVVVAVLAGAINTRLVAAVRRAGGKPVGLTGADATVATVQARGADRRASAGATVDLGPGRRAGRQRRAAAADRPAGARLRAGRRVHRRDARRPAAQRQRRHAGVAPGGALGARRLVIAGGTAGVLDADGPDDRAADDARGRAADQGGHGEQGHGGQARRRAARRCSSGVGDVVIANGRDVRLDTLADAEGVARRLHTGGAMTDDIRRHPDARSAARAPDLPAAAGGVRARQRPASVRRRRPRVPRLRVGHRRRVARARASGARGGDRRPGGDAAAHVEPLLPPVSGRGGRAAGGALRPAARVLLQQRHRGHRGVPEVRAPLLVHAGRDGPHRVRRPRARLRRPHDGRAVGDARRALSRAVRAADRAGDVRRSRRRPMRSPRRSPTARRRSSPSRSRAKAACGRCRAAFARRDQRRLPHAPGTLLIADEVQTGLGRTGLSVLLPGARLAAGSDLGRQGARLAACRSARRSSPSASRSAISPGDHGSTYGGNLLPRARPRSSSSS